MKALKARRSAELGKALKSQNPTARVVLLGLGTQLVFLAILALPIPSSQGSYRDWTSEACGRVTSFVLDKGEGGDIPLWPLAALDSTSSNWLLSSSRRRPDVLRLCHLGLDRSTGERRGYCVIRGIWPCSHPGFLNPSFPLSVSFRCTV